MLTIENNVLVKCDENATEVVIPEGVTEIKYNAFKGCKSLKSIVIPKGVTKIGFSAFEDCQSLSSIVIPEGVNKIESNIFENCKSLVSIELPEGVTEIGYDAFSGCESLKSITIPDSLNKIWDSEFKNFVALSNIKYGGTIEKWNIQYSGLFHDVSSEITVECRDGIAIPFSKQENIVSVVIPDSVNKISDFAFENCATLTSIIIPESVEKIGKYAFAGCKSLKSIVIPDSVYEIGEGIFKDCETLSSVTLSKGIDDIPSEAFYNCTSLTSIEMPESVRFIEEFALCNTSKLKTITLHDRLRSIYNNAFKDSGIENINFKGSEYDWARIKIDQPWGIPCKYMNFNVTVHRSDGDMPFVEVLSSDANGVLYGTKGKLIKCDENATDVMIPADINKFAPSAFEGCKSLKTLRFTKDFDFVSLYDEFDPSNDWDDSFGIFVFDSLTDVYYEGTTVEWIDAAGFLFFPKHVKIHCSDGDASPLTPDMEKIVIPAGVTELPNYAFYGFNCKEIELPDSVIEIGDKAFENSSIETINFKGTKEQWEKVIKDQPWGTYRELREWMVSIVHCSDGDAPFFDKDVVIDDNGVLLEPADFFIFDYTIPADVKKIARYAFDVEDNVDDPRSESDSEFELTYEGTIEQWFKIDKGENWDGNKVAVVHCSDGDIQINKGNKELDEKLLKAVSEGNLEEVKKLIIAGANVNATDECGSSILFHSIWRNDKEIAELLINNGADINDSRSGKPPLTFAARNKEIFDLLVKHGADLELVKNDEGFFIALVETNNLQAVELLVDHGANIESYYSNRETALMVACENNAQSVADYLIKKGADVNASDGCKRTPLMLAAEKNAKEIAEQLINRGANINASNIQGETAVSLAAGHNANDVLSLLINHGCDINYADSMGISLLMKAARSNSMKTAKILLENGVDINAVDASGTTALSYAAYYRSEEVYNLLKENGAECNSKFDMIYINEEDGIEDCDANAISINIPSSAYYIESDAFRGCSHLKSISITKWLNPFGGDGHRYNYEEWNNFSVCTSLEEINYLGTKDEWTFSSGFTSVVPNNVIIHCSDGDISNGDAVKKLSEDSLVIPEGITIIGHSVFRDRNYNSITLPSTLNYIEDWAFKYCNINTLILPQNWKKQTFDFSIACEDCHIDTVIIPQHLKESDLSFGCDCDIGEIKHS